jgi:hypothetical protein
MAMYHLFGKVAHREGVLHVSSPAVPCHCFCVLALLGQKSGIIIHANYVSIDARQAFRTHLQILVSQLGVFPDPDAVTVRLAEGPHGSVQGSIADVEQLAELTGAMRDTALEPVDATFRVGLLYPIALEEDAPEGIHSDRLPPCSKFGVQLDRFAAFSQVLVCRRSVEHNDGLVDPLDLGCG